MPRFRAWSWKITDENMLPCSVMAIAGIFSSTALSSSSSMRHAPSSSEYSEWRWRCTNSLMAGLSFPFNRGRRLGTDVEHHPVDAFHLVHDPRRDRGEQFVRQARPVGGHAVLALHGAD